MTTILSPIFGDFDNKERKIISEKASEWSRRFCRDGIPILLPAATLQILHDYPSSLTAIIMMLASLTCLIWVSIHLPAMIGRRQYEECCSLYKPFLAYCFWTATANFIAGILGFSGFVLTSLGATGGTLYLNYIFLIG